MSTPSIDSNFDPVTYGDPTAEEVKVPANQALVAEVVAPIFVCHGGCPLFPRPPCTRNKAIAAVVLVGLYVWGFTTLFTYRALKSQQCGSGSFIP